MYVDTCTRVNVCLQLCVQVWVHVHTGMFLDVHMYVQVCKHCAYIQVCVHCACLWVCIQECVHVQECA